MALPSLQNLGVQTQGWGYSSPSSISPGAMAGFSAVASIATAVGSHFARASQYDIQKIQASTRAKAAKVQGEADALTLLRQFNQTQASNAVMAAAQGRSGGSVEQIAEAAEAGYKWDADFTKLSAEIQESGYSSQAKQFDIAADTELFGGSFSSIAGTATKYGTSLYSIGGSSKGKE